MAADFPVEEFGSVTDDATLRGGTEAVRPNGITHTQHDAARPLEALGIGEKEECVYRALLAHHMATAAQIADELSLPQRDTTQLLASLEAKGLASHSPNTPRVYIAAPPEFIIDALIRQGQARLEQARAAIPDLQRQTPRAVRDDGGERILELIANRAHLGLVIAQMHKSFRRELVTFQRAPVLVPASRTTGSLPPGARARTISDTSFLETPGALKMLQEDIARGEEARTFPALPFKMMVIDRSVGVITLVSEKPETAPTLLVHRSALLEALCLLFEFVWEKSTPILSVQGRTVQTGNADTHFAELADALVPLLAAGLNDKAIAHELHISAATLNRRIGELMKAYGTRSRFQLGWRAALDATRTHAHASSNGHVAIEQPDHHAMDEVMDFHHEDHPSSFYIARAPSHE